MSELHKNKSTRELFIRVQAILTALQHDLMYISKNAKQDLQSNCD